MASGAVREGVFAINKPRGPTSAQIVRDCQEAFKSSAFFKPLVDAEIKRTKDARANNGNRRTKAEKNANKVKIGHGGTLDPLATGIIILGVGAGTKVLSQFLDCAKTYEATVVFGAATDTYDRCGRVLVRRPYEHITREKVEKELENFRGTRVQMPPLYSALKMNGKPLYEYAREGKPIPREIKGREVNAFDIEILEWYEPKSHRFHWPTDEAEAAERNVAEQVWKATSRQETSKKLTEEEKSADDQAVEEHESFKKSFEERQDQLIRDKPSKKQRPSKNPALMSGALGPMPERNATPRKFVPDEPDESAAPPWSDEGPPAVKIRLSVSSGYYVRSFCHDLGSRLDSAALMSELSRTRQSDFTIGGVTCLEYEDLGKGEEVWGPKLDRMLAQWNGEPGPPEAYLAQPEAVRGRKQKQGSSPQKRPRSPRSDSPSSAPPKKEPKMEASPQRRAESSKSWEGIGE